jgi:hypothetical protein
MSGWRVQNELKQRRHAIIASAKSKRGEQQFWTSAGVVVWAKIRIGHLPNTISSSAWAFFFPVAQQPLSGLDRFIVVEFSR